MGDRYSNLHKRKKPKRVGIRYRGTKRFKIRDTKICFNENKKGE